MLRIIEEYERSSAIVDEILTRLVKPNTSLINNSMSAKLEVIRDYLLKHD